jgi:6-phosphogluconolactonase
LWIFRARRPSDRARGAFLVALSGSIAPLFYPALARLALDWSRIDFLGGRARGAPDHADSNFAEANRLWLKPAAARTHPSCAAKMPTCGARPRYAAELRRIVTTSGSGFALLGVGPDGHVASSLSRSSGIGGKPRVGPVEDAPKPPPRRITLTMPVLAATARIIVAAVGEAKSEVVRQAIQPGSTLPLGVLISRARNLRVLLLK